MTCTEPWPIGRATQTESFITVKDLSPFLSLTEKSVVFPQVMEQLQILSEQCTLEAVATALTMLQGGPIDKDGVRTSGSRGTEYTQGKILSSKEFTPVGNMPVHS